MFRFSNEKRTAFFGNAACYTSLLTFVLVIYLGAMTARADAGLPTGGLVPVEMPEVVAPVVLTSDTGSVKADVLRSEPSDTGRYYEYLSDVEKALYKIYVGASKNRASYGTSTSDATELDPHAFATAVSEQVYNDISGRRFTGINVNHAYEAAVFDHIDSIEITMCALKKVGGYTLNGQYFAWGVSVATTTDDYDKMNAELRSARESFWQGIAADSENRDYVNELIVHDALLNNVTYDYTGARNGKTADLCHTAYGAIVNGSAVCDGYAQALSYLLNYKNIETLIIAGKGNGDGHAWNRVKLGNDWYEVDSTWDDDQDSSDEAKRHAYFNGTTELTGHTRTTDYLGGYMDTPAAQGTQYTYDNIKNAVSYVPVNGLDADKTAATINVGSSDTINITLTPANATNKYIKWTTEDAQVAQVTNGVITAVKPGTTRIHAVAGDNSAYSAVISVTVISPVTGIQLDKTSLSMNVGDKQTLQVTVLPTSAENRSYHFSTTDEKVAVVSDNVLTAVGEGSATITVISDENSQITAQCQVTVTKPVTQPDPSSGEDTQAASTDEKKDDKGDTQTEQATVSYKPGKNKNIKTASIPESITDAGGRVCTVTEISANAFKGCKKLKKVVVPKTVTQISKGAFKNCSNLGTIKIWGASLTKVEKNAFKGIKKGAKITICVSGRSRYNKLVRLIKKAGATDAEFVFKKK